MDDSRLSQYLSYFITGRRSLLFCIGFVFLLLACLIGLLQPIISCDDGGGTNNKNKQEMETIEKKDMSSSASLLSKITVDESEPRRPAFEIYPNDCESPLHSREAFDRIYEAGSWSHNQPLRKPQDFYNNAHWPPSELSRNSTSGGGSDRGPATENSLAIILDIIDKFNVTSMIDIPCGDVNWIMDSYVTDTLAVYIGLDITNDVIELNKLRFGHHVNKHFYFWDAASCALPMFRGAIAAAVATDGEDVVDEMSYKPVDLVHVRDVIQHLSLAQGVQYFCNVFRSGARVLITTSYFNAAANQDIGEGGWYQNNLRLEPFSFPEVDCVKTHPDIEPDFTCVYDLTEAWVGQFVVEKCSS